MFTVIRILLIDSSALFRRALATLLNHRRRMRVVGEVASGAEALEQLHWAEPDVVLVNPTVDDGGAELIATLARERPDCAVIVLCADPDNDLVNSALQSGARGYLLKNCEPDDLVRTIERVHAGELVVASPVAGNVFKHSGNATAQGPGSGALTEREDEVLRLVALGMTNAQIAQELAITEHTVKTHLAKVLGKLGVENRVQLATYAFERGLVGPASNAAGS